MVLITTLVLEDEPQEYKFIFSLDHLSFFCPSKKCLIFFQTSISPWLKENLSNLWCSDYRKIHLQVKKLNLHNFTHVCLGKILWVLIITPQAERNYPCPPGSIFPKSVPHKQSGGRNSKYLKQNKEIEQNWARLEKKNLRNFCICTLFDCYWQSFISGRETGH